MADCFDATETLDYELVESQRQKELALERQRVADYRAGAADGSKLETALQKGFDEGFERGGAISEAIYTSLGILKCSLAIIMQQKEKRIAIGKRKRIEQTKDDILIDFKLNEDHVDDNGLVDNNHNLVDDNIIDENLVDDNIIDKWILSIQTIINEISSAARPLFNALMKTTGEDGSELIDKVIHSVLEAKNLLRVMPLLKHLHEISGDDKVGDDKVKGVEALIVILDDCIETFGIEKIKFQS